MFVVAIFFLHLFIPVYSFLRMYPFGGGGRGRDTYDHFLEGMALIDSNLSDLYDQHHQGDLLHS